MVGAAECESDDFGDFDDLRDTNLRKGFMAVNDVDVECGDEDKGVRSWKNESAGERTKDAIISSECALGCDCSCEVLVAFGPNNEVRNYARSDLDCGVLCSEIGPTRLVLTLILAYFICVLHTCSYGWHCWHPVTCTVCLVGAYADPSCGKKWRTAGYRTS